MENTMETIARYIETNYSSFGLTSSSDLKLIATPSQSLPDGAKWLVLLEEETVPNTIMTVPFSDTTVPKSAQCYLSKLKMECRTRNPDPVSTPDFLWDTARQMRDCVFEALSDSQGNGLVLTRYDWTDPQNPIEAGEIWFEVSSSSSPLETYLEDSTDPNNKSIILTYTVHWWKSSLSGDTIACDPWLEALAAWTESELGTEWTVLRNNYHHVPQLPAVVWNVTRVKTKPISTNLFEVNKKFTAEVTGLLPNQLSSASLAIVQGLVKQIKIPYDILSNQYLTVVKARVVPNTDSSLKTKVKVILSRRTQNILEEPPLITAVHNVGSFQE